MKKILFFAALTFASCTPEFDGYTPLYPGDKYVEFYPDGTSDTTSCETKTYIGSHRGTAIIKAENGLGGHRIIKRTSNPVKIIYPNNNP